MSPTESNLLPDFERQIFVNLYLHELNEKKKAMSGNK